MREQESEQDLLAFLEDLAARWSDDLAELADRAREARREASARRNQREAFKRRLRRDRGSRP